MCCCRRASSQGGRGCDGSRTKQENRSKYARAVGCIQWPQVLSLLISLLVPVTPCNFLVASVERGFSAMKLIKTDRRNRLAEDSLDALMRIWLEVPPISEFDFDRAFALWKAQKCRLIEL